MLHWGFPEGSDSKESVYKTVGLGLTAGSGRPPGEGNGNPLQYSCLENPMNRGAWLFIVCRVSEVSDTAEHLHTHAHARIHLVTSSLEYSGPISVRANENMFSG